MYNYDIYNGKEKKIQFSIDNLTMVGEFKEKEFFYVLYKYYADIVDNSRIIRTRSEFFEFSFMINNQLFLQIDSLTNKCRMEFNPNKVDFDTRKHINRILKYITNIHYTRIDLAIDLFNYNISDYKIIDIANRKKAYFYGRNNKLETMYSGSNKSSKYIRIYNKAVEQNISDLDWWRFELQLRDVYIDKYLSDMIDFFENIYIFKYNSIDNLTMQENAMLEYLLADITRLNEFSRRESRQKYKRIIKELELESVDFLSDIINITTDKVNNYLNYICNFNLLPAYLDVNR